MSWTDYIKRKGTTDDIIPGTGEVTDEPCPLCGRLTFKMRPCCSSKYWTIECNPCGYKKVLEGENG